MNTASALSDVARGSSPRARVEPRAVELWGFIILLVLLNWSLFCGGNTDLFAYQPAALRAGEWWRIVTHPWVHVSWYHFLLDAAAFLILYHGLLVQSPWQRLGCVVASAAGSLAMALHASPLMVTLHGLRGLSGVDHGLMIFSMLELVSLRAGGRRLRILGGFGVAVVLGKVLWESCVGTALFAGLHFDLLGVPVVTCHAGGVCGAILYWMLARQFNRNAPVNSTAVCLYGPLSGISPSIDPPNRSVVKSPGDLSVSRSR